jgi:hypothetical protein
LVSWLDSPQGEIHGKTIFFPESIGLNANLNNLRYPLQTCPEKMDTIAVIWYNNIINKRCLYYTTARHRGQDF